ncbi:hypothetical protein KM043_003595 [Ampulex compressa]|nr:hypothetical protein KM043_003595 [Ampulex compressa]
MIPRLPAAPASNSRRTFAPRFLRLHLSCLALSENSREQLRMPSATSAGETMSVAPAARRVGDETSRRECLNKLENHPERLSNKLGDESEALDGLRCDVK